MMADRVIFVCTIVIAAVYLYATTLIPSLEIGDPLGPKAFPRLLGGALLLSAALLFVEIWKDRRTAARVAADAPRQWPLHITLMIGGVALWTAGYYLAFQPLGFIVATSVYLLGLMAWFHRGKWIANVASAVLFAVLSYVMFVKLDVNLPRGVGPFAWVADAVHAIADFIVNAFKAILPGSSSGPK